MSTAKKNHVRVPVSVSVPVSVPVSAAGASKTNPVWEAIRDSEVRGRMLSVTRRISPSRTDAEDAFQDAVVQALSHATRFRADSRVSTWLHRIAVNAALMGRRRAATWTRRWVAAGARPGRDSDSWEGPAVGAAPELPDPSASAEQQLVALEERQQLLLAISLLSAQSRRTIEAVLSDERPAEAIVGAVDGLADVSPNALRARLSRARSRLKEILDGLDVGLPRTA